jgi:glycosyltransferase involved in cell wall biosynthesis
MEISYILPTLDEEGHLASALESALKQSGEKEIIVVDAGSQDDTREFARVYGCRTILSAPGRGVQMNQGAAAATKDTLLFLHADTILPDGAPENPISNRHASRLFSARVQA